MTFRIISGLQWAHTTSRPPTIPVGRPRGAKRAGVKYEEQVAAGLLCHFGDAVHGQWFAYRDHSGLGYCQTDLLVELRDEVLVFECKYTYTPLAIGQLEKLYRPIVEHVYRKPMRGVVVCKVLTPDCPLKVVSRVMDTLLPCRRTSVVWHNLDGGPGILRSRPRVPTKKDREALLALV